MKIYQLAKNILCLLATFFIIGNNVPIYAQIEVAKREAIMNCEIAVISRTVDSTICFANPSCQFAYENMNVPGNGLFIVLSNQDSSTLLYKVQIFNNKKEGYEYSSWADHYFETFNSYSNGILNGPSISYANGRIEFIINYKNGERTGDSYRYFYDKSGKVIQYTLYNHKNKMKRTIKL